MRAVVLLVVGILVGALGAVTAIGAMKKDIPLPKASMTMMKHHFGALRGLPDGGKCDAPTIRRHLAGLQALGTEFHAFLPTGGDDAAFEKHAANYAATIDRVAAAPPADCTALAAANQTLGGACKACHDDFRN